MSQPNKSFTEPRLCFVKDAFAWFTTCEDQRGDDWNDAPWYCNAGDPFEWTERDRELYGTEPYELVKVAWDGSFLTPSWWYDKEPAYLNRHYSADEINAGAVPWLRTDIYTFGKVEPVAIYAGVTIREFIHLIHVGGGEAFTRVELPTGVEELVGYP